ncbi:MAG: hypothetical protein LBQ66_00220 [Planctomycetaceae bacterium]|nr:hypothetical protein [Planctomycetaceae bacterium]
MPVEIPTRFTHLWDEGKPRPYNVSVFWFWGDRNSGVCWRSSCRLADNVR